jgi:hypothetical protein
MDPQLDHSEGPYCICENTLVAVCAAFLGIYADLSSVRESNVTLLSLNYKSQFLRDCRVPRCSRDS